MSSSSDTIVTWQTVERYTFQIAGPIMMLIGSVGCFINLLVFSQKTLRKNPCAIYFIAFNISNFLFICSLLLHLTLSLGYRIDPSLQIMDICRLRVYTAVLFNTLSPFYLLLASIDRTLVTSPNVRTRQRSTQRLAFICISVGLIFWSLFHSHVLIFSTVLQLSPTYSVCYFPRNDYRIFVGYYLLMKEIIALLLMILCGLWSIKNVQRIRRVDVGGDPSMIRADAKTFANTTSGKDRQMILMLLLDIIIYILFSFSYAIMLVYQQMTRYDIKSTERVEIERVIINRSLFVINIPSCTSCYANLIASKTFRNAVKKVLF